MNNKLYEYKLRNFNQVTNKVDFLFREAGAWKWNTRSTTPSFRVFDYLIENPNVLKNTYLSTVHSTSKTSMPFTMISFFKGKDKVFTGQKTDFVDVFVEKVGNRYRSRIKAKSHWTRFERIYS